MAKKIEDLMSMNGRLIAEMKTMKRQPGRPPGTGKNQVMA